MTTTQPALTRQQYDDLFADEMKSISHVAEGYLTAEKEDRAEWERFQESPHEYSIDHARTILENMQSSAALAEHFSPSHVVYLQSKATDRHFIEHKEGRAKALAAELAGKSAPRAGFIESLTKFLHEIPGKLYKPGVTPEERIRLTEERDAKEATAAAADWQIADAERKIAYFLQNPEPVNYTSAVGSIALIKF